MEILPIRHATCLINYGGKKILLDPVFSQASAMTAIPGVPNNANNPLVELPLPVEEIVKGVDGILITHTHRDHFDIPAMERLSKEIPLFCQPNDVTKIKEAGFQDVRPVDKNVEWGPISIHRTGGRHGRGYIGYKMGPVSGFILSVENEFRLYITGDTIWCKPVKMAIQAHQPQIILAYTGFAKFKHGGPITMGKSDLMKIVKFYPTAQLIAIHMEAWNHCRLTREELRQWVTQNSLNQNIQVPDNGEHITF